VQLRTFGFTFFTIVATSLQRMANDASNRSAENPAQQIFCSFGGWLPRDALSSGRCSHNCDLTAGLVLIDELSLIADVGRNTFPEQHSSKTINCRCVVAHLTCESPAR